MVVEEEEEEEEQQIVTTTIDFEAQPSFLSVDNEKLLKAHD